MQPGQVHLGMAFTGSYLRVEHDTIVEPEPGVDPADAARTHLLRIGLMQLALDAQFGFHERFAAQFSLPINANVIRADNLDAEGMSIPGYTSIHHRDETVAGVGDLQVAGRIGVVRPEQVLRWTLDAKLGVALPTGRTQPDPFGLAAQGQVHQHMFFGSGTVDPVLGLQSRVAFDKWSLLTSVDARLRLYRNDHGYNAGHLVSASLGAATSFGLERWAFALQPEIQWASAASWARQTGANQPALNSGRLVLLVGAGAYFSATPAWQVFVQAKAPMILQARGGDLSWPMLGSVGFRYSFSLQPERPHSHADAHDNDHEGDHDPAAQREGGDTKPGQHGH